jgi:hypothetical protein
LLRYKEKEDIEARFVEVDEAVERWRESLQDVPPDLRAEFLARLRISLIYHDAALEGEVQDNPLHRLYYHEISPPEKITYRMRKFGEWLDNPAIQALHPVERAAKTHFRLMGIFPWAKRSGRTARIVANLLLMQADYPIAIIHSIDRQRYYEALRSDNSEIVSVYLEAVETTALSEVQVYEEASRGNRRRRRA